MKYIQQDWQGSVRAVTNANGFVVARTDHQAFGGEIGATVGQRAIEQGYNVDKVAKQGYALTETDESSGQQHAWFRKLETQAGRWTSPDPYKGSMSLGDPQSFNRYSYVQNDPANFVDPSGLIWKFACTTVNYPGGAPEIGCEMFWDPTPGPRWGGYNPPDKRVPTDPGTPPPPKPPDDPCAGKKGILDFSQRMDNHIYPNHISTSTYPDKSKYTFWPWQVKASQYKAQVISFGQTTFENGVSVQEGNSVVYSYAFFGLDAGKNWAFREVGIDGTNGDATNVNTVVVNATDCKSVITAYPGLPRQFKTIPGAIFKSGGWSTQHRSPF